MQSVAQSVLVFTITHSSTAIGGVLALQTLPVLILGPYAGVIADRVDKRRLMVVLQSFMGVQALVLGVLAVTHLVRFWEVCILAVVLGLNNTFENPARQSFVLEMVGAEEVRNAVEPQLDDGERGASRWPGRGGPANRNRRCGHLFPRQCREFRGRRLLARLDGHRRSPPEQAGRSDEGPVARGVSLCREGAQARCPPSHDGDSRDARVRVPGHLARGREADVPRWGSDVRFPHGLDGSRCRHRRARYRHPRSHGASDSHDGGRAVRSGNPRCIGLASARPRASRRWGRLVGQASRFSRPATRRSSCRLRLRCADG